MTNLPVPVPASVVPGTFMTAALWNANVYNGLTFLLNPPDFVGVQNTAQSIPSGAWTAVSLDTSQIDSYGGHSNVTNSSRYTAQVAGWYTCCGVSEMATNASGDRAVRLQVNGTAVKGAAALVGPYSGNGVALPTPTRDVYLNVGDYVEVATFQTSGGALSTAVSADLCSALWVRFSHA